MRARRSQYAHPRRTQGPSCGDTRGTTHPLRDSACNGPHVGVCGPSTRAGICRDSDDKDIRTRNDVHCSHRMCCVHQCKSSEGRVCVLLFKVRLGHGATFAWGLMKEQTHSRWYCCVPWKKSLTHRNKHAPSLTISLSVTQRGARQRVARFSGSRMEIHRLKRLSRSLRDRTHVSFGTLPI